ncbi:MAG: molecular chaperone DnaJ [Streptococcaceae bacterium]|nr:molecular chaperone DnaJ [Streptococcaceae bacterium]
MASKRDYYEILGLSKGSTEQEIKKAYRKLSKQYHPDINQKAGAEEKFKEISEAYEILSDPQKRAAYDQYGFAGTDPNYNGGGFSGFSSQDFSGFSSSGFGGFEDIFESFFGGGKRSSSSNTARAGSDLQYSVNLTFEEAIFGVEKEIRYAREDECHMCLGSGAKPGTSPITCSKCHGTGQINVERQTPLGRMVSQQVCSVCHGTGKEIKEKCSTCHGTGHKSRQHKVKVNVPAGVENGQQMRLQNQGEAGSNGGPYGDLYVIFRVAESDTFKRDGSEIFYELSLNFPQVALGDEVAVPTVHGDVKLKIPAGTQTGTNFRLRGKGAPKLRGSGHGDEHVVVKVVTPKNLNQKQKEALREFAKVSGYKYPNENKNESFFDKFKKR